MHTMPSPSMPDDACLRSPDSTRLRLLARRRGKRDGVDVRPRTRKGADKPANASGISARRWFHPLLRHAHGRPMTTRSGWQSHAGAAFDRRVCLAANRWGTRRAVGLFFGTVSRLGDGMFWYALMLALVAMDSRRGWLAAAHMALTGLTALLLYRLLKRHTRRPRPFRACPGVIAHVPPLDEFSFPSGHTLQAVSFTVVALAWYPLLAPLLLSFTALVAVSRVILGLHYPSDVLAAIGIGGALGAASLWAMHAASLLV